MLAFANSIKHKAQLTIRVIKFFPEGNMNECLLSLKNKNVNLVVALEEKSVDR